MDLVRHQGQDVWIMTHRDGRGGNEIVRCEEITMAKRTTLIISEFVGHLFFEKEDRLNSRRSVGTRLATIRPESHTA